MVRRVVGSVLHYIYWLVTVMQRATLYMHTHFVLWVT